MKNYWLNKRNFDRKVIYIDVSKLSLKNAKTFLDNLKEIYKMK